jgi:HlyD family secretion protein
MTADVVAAGQPAGPPPEAAPQPGETPSRSPSARPPTAAAAVVAIVIAVIVGLSLWYLAQPQPLLVQGEADSTRIDIAARVDGRVERVPAVRGADVAAGASLVVIQNPELIAKLREAEATLAVAGAELARVRAGSRKEVVAVRKAEIDRAAAAVTLARQTHERIRQLAANNFAAQQKLDETTDALQVAQRGYDQARLGYEEAVAGFTREEHLMAEAKVKKAEAAVATLQALVDQLTVAAPLASQVYQVGIERGEVVAPGVPLLTVVDLADIWLRFDLREDLVGGLKVGDRLTVRLPALGDRQIAAEVRLIATKGEYAGWRATRATGDFDLRTFQIRAYPVEPVPGLRPGMSAYTDWAAARR